MHDGKIQMYSDAQLENTAVSLAKGLANFMDIANKRERRVDTLIPMQYKSRS